MSRFAKGLARNGLTQTDQPTTIHPTADLRDTKRSLRVEYNSSRKWISETVDHGLNCVRTPVKKEFPVVTSDRRITEGTYRANRCGERVELADPIDPCRAGDPR